MGRISTTSFQGHPLLQSSLLFILLPPLLVGCASTSTSSSPRRARVRLLAAGPARATTSALARKAYLQLQVEEAESLLEQKAAGVQLRSAEASPPDEARAALEQARTLYRLLRFAEALSLLEQTLERLARRASSPEELATLGQLGLQRGLNLLALRRTEEAQLAFSLAFTLGLTSVAPGEYSPEIEAELRAAQKIAHGPKNGGLTIKVLPKQAIAYLDGQKQGPAPLTVPLTPGYHHLRLEMAGYLGQGFLTLIPAEKIERAEVVLRGQPQRQLAAELLRRQRQGEPLGDQQPELLRRVLGSERPLLAVTQKPTQLEGQLIWWVGQEGTPPLLARCVKGSPQLLSDCLGPLLYEHATGESLTAAKVPPSSRPFYATWWFWSAVGLAVSGAVATGIYFGARDQGVAVEIMSR